MRQRAELTDPRKAAVDGQFGTSHPGGNPMNESRFMVVHVRVVTDQPFELRGDAGNWDNSTRKWTNHRRGRRPGSGWKGA